MSLHAILEKLIHNATFRTEDEKHEALEMLDATVDRPEPPGPSSIARTTFRPPVPLDAAGNPVIVPTGMTSAQADELIALLKAQQAPPPMPAAPAPVAPADVPPGVT